MCDIEPVEPYDVPFPEREEKRGVDEVSIVNTLPGRREPFHVVHLSDMHIDPEYTVSTLSHWSRLRHF